MFHNIPYANPMCRRQIENGMLCQLLFNRHNLRQVGISLPAVFGTMAYKWPLCPRAGLLSDTGNRIVVPIVSQLAFSPVMLRP